MKTLLFTRNLFVAVAVGAIVFGNSVIAAVADENELKLKTEKVIVFKDGYCLIVKRGTAIADKNGDVYTAEVPDSAVLGSFWARLGWPSRRRRHFLGWRA